jgi:hypothetical protein
VGKKMNSDTSGIEESFIVILMHPLMTESQQQSRRSLVRKAADKSKRVITLMPTHIEISPPTPFRKS